MTIATLEPDQLLPGGRLGETRYIFDFEADFARDLRCIPMVVRFKLDRCGIKLSLRQWSRIGPDSRFALADRACDRAAEVAAYRADLLAMIAARRSGLPVFLPVHQTPVWADASRLPVQIVAMTETVGAPAINPATWSGLSTLKRFALLKLTRPGHDNENFLPALREFGLA